MTIRKYLSMGCFITGVLYACTPGSLNAQNLVPNHSFELYNAPPERDGDFSKLLNWKNPSGHDRDNYAFGTPDFFHAKGTGKGQTPNTGMGIIFPQEGDGVAGFITYNSQDKELPNFREYLQVQLLHPVQAKNEYEISFYLSNGDINQYGKFATNHIGLLFTDGPVIQNGNQPLFLLPQVEINEAVYTTSWQEFSFKYTPDTDYDYITIGNFYDDANTTVVERGHGTFSGDYAYYFIDNFSIKRTTDKNTSEPEQRPAEEPVSEPGNMGDVSPPVDIPEAISVPEQKKPAPIATPDPLQKIPGKVTPSKPNPITPPLKIKKETIKKQLLSNKTIRIDIHFMADSFNLVETHYPELDTIYQFLLEFPSKTIEIGGHTNGLCTEKFCNELSAKRALSVAKYILKKGKIAPSQIKTKGYGKSRQLASNDTASGRKKNQRVEIKVVDH